jgi:hypothetical protein
MRPIRRVPVTSMLRRFRSSAGVGTGGVVSSRSSSGLLQPAA